MLFGQLRLPTPVSTYIGSHIWARCDFYPGFRMEYKGNDLMSCRLGNRMCEKPSSDDVSMEKGKLANKLLINDDSSTNVF